MTAHEDRIHSERVHPIGRFNTLIPVLQAYEEDA